MAGIEVIDWGQAPFDWPAEQKLLLVAVDTPQTSIREVARQQVRSVIREILGLLLHCAPQAVPLLSQPGQAPHLADHPEIGLSISHEAGLSLIAIHLDGPVGIDLLRLPEQAVWHAEIDRLAADYLGCAISGESPAKRGENFARAWTTHEAKLKCRGLALEEFSPRLQQELAGCQTEHLQLREGFVGSLARLNT